MKQKTRTNIFWKVKARDKVSPARLFADTDRDGVANVFDCQPFNNRRQDRLPLKTQKDIDQLAKANEKDHVWAARVVGRTKIYGKKEWVYSDGSTGPEGGEDVQED